MRLIAFRGANTVAANEPEAILDATEALMQELIGRNGLETGDLVSCFFTLTPDLNAEFPAVAARRMGLSRVPLMCAQEIGVPGAMESVIRVMIHAYADAPPGEYVAEAAALAWLREPGSLGVPAVLGASDELLALEWLDEGPAGDAAELGRGLARVHAAGADRFGGHGPLRIGRIELPNGSAGDWPSFYADQRLRPLVAPARERGALSGSGAAAVERVCDRIADLAGPAEPPARLHGDLWGGNVLWSGRRPYLIDPIAYGGHREVDLAMLRLFGAPGPRFLAAYEDVTPLAAGHEDRVALYQLFPLLVHTVLFGGSYGASAERAARQYAG